MKRLIGFIAIFSYCSYCLGVATDDFSFTQKELHQQGESKCYLPVKVQCAEDIELQLMIGDLFTDPVFVEANPDGMAAYRCIRVPCTKEGKVVGNIMVVGNDITMKPELLKNSLAFSSKDQCDAASDESYVSEITCNTDSMELENQEGEIDFENHPGVINSVQVSEEAANDQKWQNKWDARLKVECSSQKGIHKVKSKHSNKKEDRLWEWSCRRVAKKRYDNGYWTGYVNKFDAPIFFNCKQNYILCGVESYHNNRKEDRRWRFKCCHAPDHYTRNCGLTDYVNRWDRPINHKVGDTEVITGVYSYHSNKKEDRRWKFAFCEYKYCRGV